MKKIISLILVAIMLVTAMPMAMAESNTYKVGDIIQFGSYPQTEVKDKALIAELNALAPEWEDWTSYGYYSGNGDYGSMVQGDWMRYIDIKHEGENYRGVMFTQYRPYITYVVSSNTYQDDNGYITNSIYWFKFEPINWIIIDPNYGLVISQMSLDSQPYTNLIYFNENACVGNNETDWEYDKNAYFSDIQFNFFASDYEHSSLRVWLNKDFYELAFSGCADEIAISEVKDINKNSDIISNTTYDKVYLLGYSYDETATLGTRAENVDGRGYGNAYLTDYAKCQGSNNNDGLGWTLRGAGITSYQNWFWLGGYDFIFMNYVSSVSPVRPVLRFGEETKIHKHRYELTFSEEVACSDGKKVYACYCGSTYSEKINGKHNYTSQITTPATHFKEGVRTYICECNDTYTESIPKLEEHTHIPTVTLPTCTAQGYTTYICECGDTYVDKYVDKLPHSYIGKTIAPTCTDKGYNRYTCSCGDSYIDNYVKEKGHIDNDGDYKCDYGCGYEFPKPEPEEKTIWEKIVDWFKNIFDKLFGWMKK